MPDFKKVTMRAVSLAPDGTQLNHEAVDYVGDDILDAYVRDARTRWQAVSVAEDDRTAEKVAAADYAVPVQFEEI